MKVFLSWSGPLSHRVACVLRDWLPSVIQAIRPYVSSEDIDKGTRWSSDIAQELEEATFGIICVTRENLVAPWINFEAGALSKTIEKSFVSPFLFRMKRSEVQGPLLQFQSTIYEKEDVSKLLISINARLPEGDRLADIQLRRSFDVWWPELTTQLDLLGEEAPSPTSAASADNRDQILEELLELARNQHRLLRSPQDLLPPWYLTRVLPQTSATDPRLLEVYDIAIQVERIVDHAGDECRECSAMRELLMLAFVLRARLGDVVDPHFRHLIGGRSPLRDAVEISEPEMPTSGNSES